MHPQSSSRGHNTCASVTALLHGMSEGLRRCIQSVQNAAARFVTGARHLEIHMLTPSLYIPSADTNFLIKILSSLLNTMFTNTAVMSALT